MAFDDKWDRFVAILGTIRAHGSFDEVLYALEKYADQRAVSNVAHGDFEYWMKARLKIALLRQELGVGPKE